MSIELPPDNVIPITRPMVEGLHKMLDMLDWSKIWTGPPSVNAILIDRKRFIRQVKVPASPIRKTFLVPNPIAHLPYTAVGQKQIVAAPFETIEFKLWDQVGDTLIYREVF